MKKSWLSGDLQVFWMFFGPKSYCRRRFQSHTNM